MALLLGPDRTQVRLREERGMKHVQDEMPRPLQIGAEKRGKRLKRGK